MRRHPHFFVLFLGWLVVCSGAAGQTNSEKLRFRLPHGMTFRFEGEPLREPPGAPPARWLRGSPDDGSTNTVEFGDQVVVQIAPGTTLGTLIGGQPLTLSRQITSNVFILQAAGAAAAVREAGRMASLPGVTASYPVVRQEVALDGLYAPRPNDPHFAAQFAGVVGQW